jgi:aminoglycoside phosphotransferase (APT) family kinase protein
VTAPAHLDAIANRFALAGPIIWVETLPGGHINDSYRVITRRADGQEVPYLLQHMNPRVFPDPVRVMENIAYVTRHLEAARRAGRTTRQALTLVPTTVGGAWMEDAARSCWRMYAFIPKMHVRDIATHPDEARESASAFGEFVRLLDSYGGPPLHETIPGFHDTPARFRQLEAAAEADSMGRAQNGREEIRELLAHRALADVLPPRLASGEIPQRIVHNDAKIANVLLDDDTGAACCVVDLDTVMPGSLLHDFGDMVRSMTTPTSEDETDLGRVGVRLDLFEAVARGYLGEVGTILVPAERELLVHAGKVITLEQAARFMTDYLEGDRYYHDTRGDQNLRRARAQLQLFRSLTERERELEQVILELRT